ncbi:LysE family translocator [Pseudonocardia ammonioxydans]|nr:LysE family transporter [Pseudonocardia ammonioxydans]
MAIGSMFGFWGLSFLLVLTPGADWAYMIRAGLRGRAVLPSLAGLLAGHLALVALVAAGVAALVARRPEVLAVLTVLGAAYLVWLGVGALLRPAGPVAVTVDGSGSRIGSRVGSGIGEAVRGAGVSGLNPKVLLLFLAVLPQFTDPGGGWSLGLQILLLGLVHVVGCAAVYAGVGVGARAVLAARPAAARVLSRCSGALMALLGVALLAGQLVG